MKIGNDFEESLVDTASNRVVLFIVGIPGLAALLTWLDAWHWIKRIVALFVGW